MTTLVDSKVVNPVFNTASLDEYAVKY